MIFFCGRPGFRRNLPPPKQNRSEWSPPGAWTGPLRRRSPIAVRRAGKMAGLHVRRGCGVTVIGIERSPERIRTLQATTKVYGDARATDKDHAIHTT